MRGIPVKTTGEEAGPVGEGKRRESQVFGEVGGI
jgi:hypothetical protein